MTTTSHQQNGQHCGSANGNHGAQKHLASRECLHDCSWYVLQASRHGIDQNAIRRTLMHILGTPMENRGEFFRRLRLLADICEYGVLTEDDAEQFPRLWQAARQVAEVEEDHRSGKEWVAKNIAKKRAEFYRMERRSKTD